MSSAWWRRVFGGQKPAPTAPAPEPSAPPASEPEPDALEPIRHADPTSKDQLRRALAALADARGSSRERAAIDAVLDARRRGRAPDELIAATADLLVQRGQLDEALKLLDGVHASSALVMAADLHAEQGRLAEALALVERVMGRDIDFPGARERHERWRRRLGAAAPPAAPRDEPTLLRHDLPATELRIVGEAGRGGAGVVYEATDDVLGRKVALKVYHRAADDCGQLEREARLAVDMAGPGVIRVFDVDPERGWIIMEWLPGGALKRWLKRAELDVLWPIERWYVPLVAALARVHAGGLVHADSEACQRAVPRSLGADRERLRSSANAGPGACRRQPRLSLAGASRVAAAHRVGRRLRPRSHPGRRARCVGARGSRDAVVRPARPMARARTHRSGSGHQPSPRRRRVARASEASERAKRVEGPEGRRARPGQSDASERAKRVEGPEGRRARPGQSEASERAKRVEGPEGRRARPGQSEASERAKRVEGPEGRRARPRTKRSERASEASRGPGGTEGPTGDAPRGSAPDRQPRLDNPWLARIFVADCRIGNATILRRQGNIDAHDLQ